MELVTIFVIFLLFILSVILGIKLASILPSQGYTILCRKNVPEESKRKKFISWIKDIFSSSSKVNKIPPATPWDRIIVTIGGNQEEPKHKIPGNEPTTLPLSETDSIDDGLEERQKRRAETEK